MNNVLACSLLITSLLVTPIAKAADSASEPPLPSSMAAIGDSITAGAVAQFTTQSWIQPQELLGIAYRLFRSKMRQSVEPAQRKDLSWSTGLNRYKWVHSHYSMISYLAHQENISYPASFNAAVSQDDSRDAFDQLGNVVHWSLTTQNKGAPDYVTIFVGANDLCQEEGVPPTPVETYRARITKLVHEVLTRNPKSKVMLIELPNISKVWAFAKEKRLSRIAKFQSCSTLWKSLDVCPSVLRDLSPKQRAFVEATNREYNRVLRETAARFSSRNSGYGKDRVRLAKGLYDRELNFDDLAIDCFHPNFRGQSKIGYETFYQSWWKPKFREHYEGYMPWVRKVQWNQFK